jgi:hypothetical protein
MRRVSHHEGRMVAMMRGILVEIYQQSPWECSPLSWIELKPFDYDRNNNDGKKEETEIGFIVFW